MAKSPSRVVKAEKKAVRSSKTAEVEPAAETSSGLGFDAGAAIVSALLLLTALVMIDHELGAAGSGMFFKK